MLRYILTVLLGHLVTDLLWLAVTLGGWDYRSYSFLHILALGYWYWTTNLPAQIKINSKRIRKKRCHKKLHLQDW